MLLELAAANAAFAVIKQTLINGRSLLDAGKAVDDYFGASSIISKEVCAKGKTSAFEAYQAQQQLMRQEEELKQLLNSQSMMGYHDFLRFKAQFAREQKEAAKELARQKYKRRQAFDEGITLGIKVMGSLLFFILTLAALYYMIRQR